VSDELETFTVQCEAGHAAELSIDELEELFEVPHCPGSDDCPAEIDSCDPSDLEVACVHCEWSLGASWSEAMQWIGSACPRCTSNTDTSGEIHLVGTHQHQVGIHVGFDPPADVSRLRRPTRPDYWEVVIHFTRRSSLVEILKQRTIIASETGFFKVPAVCMSETPLEFSGEIKSRFGEYGLAFRKSDVIRFGGGPVLYLSDQLVEEQRAKGDFAAGLRPFVNVLRIPSTAASVRRAKKFDFLHEREWRVPKDVPLDELLPVGLVLPRQEGGQRFSGDDGPILLKAAREYGEL